MNAPKDWRPATAEARLRIFLFCATLVSIIYFAALALVGDHSPTTRWIILLLLLVLAIGSIARILAIHKGSKDLAGKIQRQRALGLDDTAQVLKEYMATRGLDVKEIPRREEGPGKPARVFEVGGGRFRFELIGVDEKLTSILAGLYPWESDPDLDDILTGLDEELTKKARA